MLFLQDVFSKLFDFFFTDLGGISFGAAFLFSFVLYLAILRLF